MKTTQQRMRQLKPTNITNIKWTRRRRKITLMASSRGLSQCSLPAALIRLAVASETRILHGKGRLWEHVSFYTTLSKTNSNTNKALAKSRYDNTYLGFCPSFPCFPYGRLYAKTNGLNALAHMFTCSQIKTNRSGAFASGKERRTCVHGVSKKLEASSIPPQNPSSDGTTTKSQYV